MEIKKVRKGNLMLTPDNIKQVTEIDGKCFYCDEFKNTWSEINPIKISEDWYRKLKFSERSDCFIKGDMLIFKSNLNVIEVNSYGIDEVIKIEFVHEVQNLWEEITGRQLKIYIKSINADIH